MSNLRISSKFDFEFARNTSLIRQIARNQMTVDPEFKKRFDDLRTKLYEKKVSGTVFWETYKKVLTKSVGKDKQILNALLKKTDKKLKQQFKEAEQKTKEQKPLIDLSLPK